MKKLNIVLAFAAALLSAHTASARQLYIAPGDDVKTTIESLMAGDTLWVQSGTYNVSDLINVRHSGSRHHRICVFGYGEGRAVLDFSSQPHTGDDYAGQFRGPMSPTMV